MLVQENYGRKDHFSCKYIFFFVLEWLNENFAKVHFFSMQRLEGNCLNKTVALSKIKKYSMCELLHSSC